MARWQQKVWDAKLKENGRVEDHDDDDDDHDHDHDHGNL